MSDQLVQSFQKINQSLQRLDQRSGLRLACAGRVVPDFKPLTKAVIAAVEAFAWLEPPAAKLGYGTWIIDYISAKNLQEQYAAFCRGYRLQEDVIVLEKLSDFQLKIAYGCWERPKWLKYLCVLRSWRMN